MPQLRFTSLLLVAAVTIACLAVDGPPARADAPGDTPLPELGVLLRLGADWHVDKSYGPAGTVIRNASREFAPLEIVAWPAPAKAVSAREAVNEHETLLRERFRYERLSATEIRTPADPHALQVTGAVTGNDGVRYAALFAAYFIGDRYVIIGTFCKPDKLGHVRRAYFDAAMVSLRAKRTDITPVVIATNPPLETAPVAGGHNGKPARGGLTPVIKALAPPETALAIHEGQPVVAKTPTLPIPGRGPLGEEGTSGLPEAGPLTVFSGAEGVKPRVLVVPSSTGMRIAKLLPPDIGGVPSVAPTMEPPGEAALGGEGPAPIAPTAAANPLAAMGGLVIGGPQGQAPTLANDLTHMPAGATNPPDKAVAPDVNLKPGSGDAAAATAGHDGGPDEGPGGNPVASGTHQPLAAGPAGATTAPAVQPGTGLAVSGDTTPAAPGTATAGLGKPLPPDVSAIPPPEATVARGASDVPGAAVMIASLAANPPPAPAPAWRTYANPYGFSLNLPPEWRVELTGGFIVAACPHAAGRATVALCPVWLGPGGDDLAATAQRALQHWTDGAAVHWTAPSVEPVTGLSPGSLAGTRLVATGDDAGVPMRLEATLIGQDRVGLLTVLQDETSRYDGHAALLRRVAGSFSGGTFALPAEAAPPGARYADATEGAFEVRLPAGWQATGGLKRYNGALALDLRLKSDAPGGATCEWRQPFTPSFREFTSFLKGLGWHERDLYSQDTRSEKLVVLKSRPPDDFLRTYLLPGGTLQAAQVVSATPDAAAAALLPMPKALAAQAIVRGSIANAPRERDYIIATGDIPSAGGNACWQAAYLMAEGVSDADAQPAAPSKAVADALVALSKVIASASVCGDWRGTDEERAALAALLAGARKATQAFAPPSVQGPIALLGAEPSTPDAPRIAVPAALTKVY